MWRRLLELQGPFLIGSALATICAPIAHADRASSCISGQIDLALFRRLAASQEYVFSEVDNFETARNLAQNLAINRDFGISFGDPNKQPLVGRLHSQQGRQIGWKVSTERVVAEYRLDWDPEKGAHFNVKYTVKGDRAVTYKAAIPFRCNGSICTEEQVLRYLRQFSR